MPKKTTERKPRINPDDMFKELDALKAQQNGTDTSKDASAEGAEGEAVKKVVKKVRARGKKYQEKRSMVDKTREYSVAEAIEMIKKLSFTKFVGSLEAHLQVKEVGTTATLTFPHSTGRSIRVAIVDEALLEQINKGVIEFDMLVARPEDMRNLAKYARVLGPKGLMPNPKNGTVTPNPEKKKKELEAGAVTLKTEKKAPLIHTMVGKLSLDDKALVENVEALFKAFENKAIKLYLCASMSPSVRVTVPKKTV